MTTRVAVGGPPTSVYPTTTAPRVTPEPARPFQQLMNAGSVAIVNGAEAAVTHLPGGGILAAAMRPSAAHVSPTLSAANPYGPSAALNRAEGPTGTATSALGTNLNGDPSSGDSSIEQVMSQDADQNLYYLKLQEQISAESRGYSAVSNVLKARHDTMKNAIGNIR
ncbi:MAG TPA: hypothetical protein VFK05_24065 [Polyangiaceae bacterium]|nr:hypothetical protein [Polyangiaceae bacterium]